MHNPAAVRIQLERTLKQDETNICDYLAAESGLPKSRIKHAMNCGALQVRSGKGKVQRLRRSSKGLPSGSRIWLYYDAGLLSLTPPQPILLEDFKSYSIWFKPPGLLSQGSQWGDHYSLLRQVELHFQHRRKVFLVHRLDQDACGLMLVAHRKQQSADLSRMFTERGIEKFYRVRVEGAMQCESGVIDSPIEGKSALTRYRVLAHTRDQNQENESTLLEVKIETGRKHQIRRHFSQLGHAVVGDALYGVKNSCGLHLAATKLVYKCPEQGRIVCVELDRAHIDRYWM